MQMYSRTVLTILQLLASSAMLAQESDHIANLDLLVRLSYQSSGSGGQQVCLAVSRDSQYHIARRGLLGQTTRLQGQMQKEQFEQLAKLLESPEFGKLSGSSGGLIRKDAESFAVEIPLGDHLRADGTGKWMEFTAHRLQWLNPDGEHPFPDSVAKVVDWVEHFR